jgi:uncharacterized protein YodC (DUF2158 family)
MNKFKIGDIVMLNSGGRYMTVSDINSDYIECSWHSENGKPQCEQYEPGCLMYRGPLQDDSDAIP